MRKLIRRILVRLGLVQMQPHEKAQAGLGSWGRQEAKAKGKASVKMRVYKAATNTWEEVA